MRFFLYGTLMTQSGTDMGRWIAARLVAAEPASVPGRLIALRTPSGWYPALLCGQGGGRVNGMLAELRLKPGDLTRLDRYEGRQYRRETVRVRTAGGLDRSAQAWRWRASTPGGVRAIHGGDFLGWLAHTGRQSFTERRDGP